jgi:hypothetical protein
MSSAALIIASATLYRVAGIFMRFYTLSHISFIYNAIEGEATKFSPASCPIAPAYGSDKREDVQGKASYVVG